MIDSKFMENQVNSSIKHKNDNDDILWNNYDEERIGKQIDDLLDEAEMLKLHDIAMVQHDNYFQNSSNTDDNNNIKVVIKKKRNDMSGFDFSRMMRPLEEALEAAAVASASLSTPLSQAEDQSQEANDDHTDLSNTLISSQGKDIEYV
jgi:hypothetical protein